MAKNTTKTGYKNGYEAAQAGKPSKSPHRAGTASEELWLEGFHAYMNGGMPPEEPRKRRTKVEMEEARSKPFEPTDWNTPSQPLPSHMIIKSKQDINRIPATPRGPGLLEKIFAAKDKLKVETDPELLELLHMEVADLEWVICAEDGPKPSTIWEQYKDDHGLNFDRTAA